MTLRATSLLVRLSRTRYTRAEPPVPSSFKKSKSVKLRIEEGEAKHCKEIAEDCNEVAEDCGEVAENCDEIADDCDEIVEARESSED